MKKLSLLLTAATLLFFACQKDTAPAADESRYYTPKLSDFAVDRSGYWTTIPAGSINALTQAIADADPGGIIYLKAGMHTETSRVTVNKRVHIIGEDGAILKISSPDTTLEVNPGIHILNAPGAVVQNIKIEPLQASAWCGIMFENSPRSAVLSCEISVFWFGVLVERSDQVAIIDNHFLNCAGNGVLVNNGKSTYVGYNEFEGSTGGSALWACDEWGTAEGNEFHNNEFGILLCKYPKEFGILTPGGAALSADKTCILWKLRSNKFNNNTDSGIIIRDSAHQNLIESNNEYSGNAKYDIVIPADEDVPGFIFIPAAYDNTIYAAPNVLIKDCGINTTINGGTLVDTTLDPC